MADYLDVDAVDGVAPEPAALQLALDQLHELVVQQVAVFMVRLVVEVDVPVAVFMVRLVVEVDVPEAVDVEIHLVVRAHAAGIDFEVGQGGEYVVYGGYGDAREPRIGHLLGDHVGAGMSELEHGVVDGEPLGSRLESLVLQEFLESECVRSGLGRFHNAKFPQK